MIKERGKNIMTDEEKSRFPRGNIVLYPISELIDSDGKVQAPFQIRSITPDLIVKIAESLEKPSDLDVPILIREVEPPHVLAGVHRILAFKTKGFDKIPAMTISCDEKTAFKIAARTNLSRENLTDFEKALTIDIARKKFKLTYEQINKEYGFGFLNKSSLSNLHRSLTQATAEVLKLWKKGDLATGHVKELIYFDKEKQNDYAEKIVSADWSIRIIENVVKNYRLQDEALVKISEVLGSKLESDDIQTIYIDGIYEHEYDFNDLIKEAKVENVFNSYWSIKDNIQPFLDILVELEYPYATKPLDETIPKPEPAETAEVWTLYDSLYHKDEKWWEKKDCDLAITKDTNEFEFFKTTADLVEFIKENEISHLTADTDLERGTIHDIVLKIHEEFSEERPTDKKELKTADKPALVSPETVQKPTEYSVLIAIEEIFSKHLKNYSDDETMISLPLLQEQTAVVLKTVRKAIETAEDKVKWMERLTEDKKA